ncbi:hypothetical protein IU486_09120 [Streptomyces gardneri]|uniref:DUF6374 family protein n=1 Tax=Nocardia TaxID=1817 RepID=UPI0013583A3A|nr:MULTISPECIES: DUF6374 family protein [Nocardia]MBF6164931.1 hypothetical protein [Streptomyces gardneri]MBF6208154.1 hypothetical protein [Streptomyces gardneri]
MPDLEPIPFAQMQINAVRRQLLDAAAFGKHLRPEQLESMAGKLAEGLRAYTEAIPPAAPPTNGRACLDYRGRLR